MKVINVEQVGRGKGACLARRVLRAVLMSLLRFGRADGQHKPAERRCGHCETGFAPLPTSIVDMVPLFRRHIAVMELSRLRGEMMRYFEEETGLSWYESGPTKSVQPDCHALLTSRCKRSAL
jgi:hypothetical protein